MTQADYTALAAILHDDRTMYAEVDMPHYLFCARRKR